MSEIDERQKLAEKIVDDLLELGNGFYEGCLVKAHRIQFKIGKYPDNERDAGGMCREPLIRFIADRLPPTGGDDRE